MPESFFTALLKKRLWHSCFPVNFAKFLRTPFFTEQFRWLLMNMFPTVDDHIQLPGNQVLLPVVICKFVYSGVTIFLSGNFHLRAS